MEHRLKENDVVSLVNTIKGISSSFLVKGLKFKYPRVATILQTGEFTFDEQESRKQVLEKIHDLESALTVVKDIREYESAAETLALVDTLNIQVSEDFLETLAMTDVDSVTEIFRAVYSTANYSTDDAYTGGGSHG